MPKIVVKRKAEIQKEVPVRPFQNIISVGSEGNNDIVIFDKKVSLNHLIIEKEDSNYYVVDKDSAFGTFINGRKIDVRTPISDGDEINIGEHSLIFENITFELNNQVEAEEDIDDSEHEDEPIEESGKEPTAQELQNMIEEAKEDGIKVIFVQSQFNKDIADSVAEEIGAVVVSIDPLSEDYIVNLRNVATRIAESLNN